MKLHELAPAHGSKKRRKRLGCGRGSGHGKTSTRGQKGQMARTGARRSPGFEGGQMPLHRRIPKRGGFRSSPHREYSWVNLDILENNFKDGDKVDKNSLFSKGIIKDPGRPVKILGRGALTKRLSIQGCLISKAAKEKIKDYVLSVS
jgi:large subunit ribosomal protein L15